MDSYVGAISQLLKAHIASLGMRSSPPPVPSNAVFPYATISNLVDSPLESLTGPSGLTRTIIQITVNAKSYEIAWSVREEVQVYLLAFAGTTSGQKIVAVNAGPRSETYDGNRSLHQLHLRLHVWWEA